MRKNSTELKVSPHISKQTNTKTDQAVDFCLLLLSTTKQEMKLKIFFLSFLFQCYLLIIQSKRKFTLQSPKKIRQEIQQFMDAGQHVDLVEYLEQIQQQKGIKQKKEGKK